MLLLRIEWGQIFILGNQVFKDKYLPPPLHMRVVKDIEVKY
jgi:hypothetical protein